MYSEKTGDKEGFEGCDEKLHLFNLQGKKSGEDPGVDFTNVFARVFCARFLYVTKT